MNFRQRLNMFAPLAVILAAWAGVTVTASAEARTAPPAQESASAARLLRDIRLDARQIRDHAWRWDLLTKSKTTNWDDFDRQWNEIKPPVEDMSLKLARLDHMKANLSPFEQKAIDGSQPLFADISSETHSLRSELDQYGNDLSNPLTPVSNSEARLLARDAGKLVQAAGKPAAAGSQATTKTN